MDGGGYRWIPTNSYGCAGLERTAVLAGYDHDKSPIYVGRAYHAGELIPCKVIPRHQVAYIPYDMKEVRVDNFELYCKATSNVSWIQAANGFVPPGAVQAGRTAAGEILYVGRAHHMGALTPGKVHPSHQCCYISFGGNEVSHKTYEVMCLQ